MSGVSRQQLVKVKTGLYCRFQILQRGGGDVYRWQLYRNDVVLRVGPDDPLGTGCAHVNEQLWSKYGGTYGLKQVVAAPILTTMNKPVEHIIGEIPRASYQTIRGLLLEQDFNAELFSKADEVYNKIDQGTVEKLDYYLLYEYLFRILLHIRRSRIHALLEPDYEQAPLLTRSLVNISQCDFVKIDCEENVVTALLDELPGSEIKCNNLGRFLIINRNDDLLALFGSNYDSLLPCEAFEDMEGEPTVAPPEWGHDAAYDGPPRPSEYEIMRLVAEAIRTPVEHLTGPALSLVEFGRNGAQLGIGRSCRSGLGNIAGTGPLLTCVRRLSTHVGMRYGLEESVAFRYAASRIAMMQSAKTVQFIAGQYYLEDRK